jgi:hypothetical protein
MKSMVVLCLLMTTLSLGACKSPSPLSADPCEWSRPILFSDATKVWLQKDGPLPEPVRADLWQIVQHNQKLADICGYRGR